MRVETFNEKMTEINEQMEKLIDQRNEINEEIRRWIQKADFLEFRNYFDAFHPNDPEGDGKDLEVWYGGDNTFMGLVTKDCKCSRYIMEYSHRFGGNDGATNALKGELRTYFEVRVKD
jgi:hypothetical protein